MERTEVAVIGAGPGGATAAYFLAEAGIKVTLFDKKTFPRDKTCGDMVTAEGLQVLEQMQLGEWSSPFKKVGALRFTSPAAAVLDIPVMPVRSDTAARIIPRRELDHELVRAAVRAGAGLRDGVCVSDIDLGGPRPVIRSDSMTMEADMVILADGSRAPLTRRLGLVREDFDLIAVQQYLFHDGDPAGPVEFHFQRTVIPGYTWLIPMGDGRLNIGAGTFTSRVRRNELDLKAVLESFKSAHPVERDFFKDARPDGPIKAHPLRTSLDGTQTHAARILVVGDAAGLVSPFTGEGIASAMWSGKQAAGRAKLALTAGDFSAGFLSTYTRDLRSRYSADKRAGRALRRILKNPSLLDHAFKRMQGDPGLAQLFMHVFLDERSPRLMFGMKTLLRLLL